MNIIIFNICKSQLFSEKLLYLCLSKSFVDKVYLISSSIDSIITTTSDKVELIRDDFSTSYNSVLFKLCDSIRDGVIAVIPDTFMFSDKLLDYVCSGLSEKKDNLYILGKENNCILDDSSENSSEDYRIYNVYDQTPSNRDYESCLFFDKVAFNKCRTFLEKFLSLKAHYFVKYFSELCLSNNLKVVYPVNERIFFNSDSALDRYEKADKNFAQKQGIIPKLHLSFKQKIFSLVNFKKHTVLTLLGLSIPFKVKKEPHFSADCREFLYLTERSRFDSNKACVFAGFTAEGKISQNELFFIKSIKKHVDYLVYVADSLATEETINLLKSECDAIIIQRHREYDFGSYKRGYELLLKNGLLNNFDNLLLCNDSVDFVGCDSDLANIFNKSNNYDAYSICTATYGFGDRIRKHRYQWIKAPHLQSYFVILKKKVFSDKCFSEFLMSVKHQKHKTEIIKQYEMGLSELLKNNNFTMGSFYPYDDTNIVNPYAIYLNQHIHHPIFIKHMLGK